jgi:hypothetical protein
MPRKRAAPEPGRDTPSSSSKASAHVAGRPRGVWLTFARARGWVMRTLGYSAEEAAEWLRELATEEVIEGGVPRPRALVVFTRSVQVQHPDNLQRLDAWTNRRKGEEEGHYFRWIRPCHEFREGPEVMDERFTKEFTRWYAPDIDAALAEETAATNRPGGRPLSPEGKKRGPTPKWDWERITAAAKLAYARDGGAMPWKNLVALIMDLAQSQTGTRPSSDSTAEQIAGEIRRDWKRSSGDPDN